MKFRLRDGYGQTAIREIGAHLRAYGSGHHWIERFRGETFVHSVNDRDERILREHFAHALEPVGDQPQ